MNKKSFTLLEYRAIYIDESLKEPHRDKNGNLAVPATIFDAIERFYYANNESQSYFVPARKYGKKALVAQNYVGVIQVKDGTTIEILPKITSIDEHASKQLLLKMLKTLKESPFKNFNMAHLKSEKMPLFEIFITMFLDELETLIQRGLKSDYIAKEENLTFLKGKLKMKEQIVRNYIHKERFFVAYDEYMSDRVENRLIKTALRFLYGKSISNWNKKRIREYLFVFDEIGISHNVRLDLSRVKLGRQMKDYELVLQWVRTFLLDHSYSPHRGNDLAFALLFDMNLLFESYVGSYLKKKKMNVRLQDHQHFLAYRHDKGRFKLKPDIVINEGKTIADTKWKILSENKAHQGVSQADMYQLYAYGTKYENCKNLFLIYPKDKFLKGSRYNFFKKDQNDSLKLHIVFFDLQNNTFTR